MLFAIGWRAYALQVLEAAEYQKLAQRQHLKDLEIPAPRGPILDRHGRELGVTAKAHSIFANPRKVVNVSATAKKIARILKTDRKVIERKLASQRFFVWLERHVSPDVADAVSEEIAEGNATGIGLTEEPRRFYPSKQLAGPVIGFAGVDGNGLDGIELTLNKELTGKRAKVAALRDASGSLMFAGGDIEAIPGHTVTLTIDRAVQYIAEKALSQAVKANKASAGIAIVLDLEDGSLLAVANNPTFDANAPGNYVARGVRNRAVTDTFEIGSIMKVFSVAAAIDNKVVTTKTMFDTEKGRYRVGRKLITDSTRDEWLSVAGILKRSSNVGAAKIAQKLGKEPLHQFLVDLEFGKRTGVKLPGERKGVVHPTRTWGETGLAAVSFGYNLAVTPLQVIAAFAAVANNGIYKTPRIIKSVDGVTSDAPFETTVNEKRVMAKETADSLLQALETVFDKGRHGGTGRKLRLNGYRAAGKSGTAHKVDKQEGGYDEKRYLSSFAGVAPLPNPRIAVLVVVDEPTAGAHYGADVAGPAFTEITEETLRYFGLLDKNIGDSQANDTIDPEVDNGLDNRHGAPKAIQQAQSTTNDQSPVHPPGPNHIWIPDFRGMGIAKALEKASEAKVEIVVEGTGFAVEQSPPPGWAEADSLCRVIFASGENER